MRGSGVASDEDRAGNCAAFRMRLSGDHAVKEAKR
jgi:hypothetical protein